jgi:hypothetical protein
MSVPQNDERTLTNDQRIELLEQQVLQLQQQLQASQMQMVEVVAGQIQSLFSNQVLIDSMAARFFTAGANALAFKVSNSQERAPELVVMEGYIPGSIRIALAEDGSVSIEQQVKGSTSISEGWESSLADFDKKGLTEKFKQLLASYGAEAGRVYYITDSVTQQKHREAMASQLASDVRPADDAVVTDEVLTVAVVSVVTRPTSAFQADPEAVDYEPVSIPEGTMFTVRGVAGQVAVESLQPGQLVEFVRNDAICLEEVVSVA